VRKRRRRRRRRRRRKRKRIVSVIVAADSVVKMIPMKSDGLILLSSGGDEVEVEAIAATGLQIHYENCSRDDPVLH
jgi:hypothetical protein